MTVLFTRGVGVWGLNIPVNWAFAIHNYVWWLGIGHAGTLISALLLLTGSDWRNSLNRFAETMTLFAVVCAGIYPIIHLGRPWYVYWMLPYPSTMDVWPQFRSPLEWDIWAVLTYLIVSIVFWYIGLVPDLAAARDRARRRGWQIFFGVTVARLARLGDALDALAPGLSADRRARRAAGRVGAQRGVAVVCRRHDSRLAFDDLPALFRAGRGVLRLRRGGDDRDRAAHAVSPRQSRHRRSSRPARQGAARDCGLMTAYGYVFEVFDALYSGDAHELQTLSDRFFGAYAWTYWGAIVFNFVVLQGLWWRIGAAHRLGAVPDLDRGRDRHVARALHDPGHQPVPRFPGVVVGRNTRRRSGTGRPISAPSGCSWCRSC